MVRFHQARHPFCWPQLHHCCPDGFDLSLWKAFVHGLPMLVSKKALIRVFAKLKELKKSKITMEVGGSL